LPIKYGADHRRAERILLEAAERRTVSIAELGSEALQEMQRRYLMKPADMRPKVYYRLTDNWVELTVRFIAHHHAIRDLKDALSGDILVRSKRKGSAWRRPRSRSRGCRCSRSTTGGVSPLGSG
jgi:hypothetical protein